jgi:hypothetical protein
MSADYQDRPACVTADEVRRIVREEMRTDRERLRQLGERVEGVWALVVKIRRGLGALGGCLKE